MQGGDAAGQRLRRRRRLRASSSLLARAITAAALAAVATMGAGCGRGREPFHIAKTDPATLRKLPAGDVIGGDGRYGAHAWLGIPFAEPPVGDLRWRAPEPLPRWEGVREATRPGPPCPQFAGLSGGLRRASPDAPVGQEDCLTLDVWAPRFAPDRVSRPPRGLPVMVWIHGGGNTIGQSGLYEGGRLAAEHGVIVIAIQYRLGPFGWFRHASLRAGAASEEDASGNFGTLDQIRALEWVRDNVAAFGGDPANVTIFGESAGGQNVFALMVAPPARGLFHRAIAQSGGLSTSTPAEAEGFPDEAEPGAAQSSSEIVARLLLRDGFASHPTAARERLATMPPAEIAAYLRSKGARDILLAYSPVPRLGMIEMPRLFSDGAVLPAGDPLESLRRPGAHAAVPLIAGTTRDETKLFQFVDPRQIRRRLWLLPRFVDEPLYLASAEYWSRAWKLGGADAPARALREAGDAPVFVYRFDWDEEPTLLGSDLSAMLGAAHGFDVPFVFGHFDFGRAGDFVFTDDNRAGREALSQAMMSYWTEFAHAGAPGRGRGGEFPTWTAWGESADAWTLLLDAPLGGGSETALRGGSDTAFRGGIRMTPIEETLEGILQALVADPRLADRRDRCWVLRGLAATSRGFDRTDYELGSGERNCSSFPYDRFPWDDAAR